MSEQSKNQFDLIVQAIDAANKKGVYNINESAMLHGALQGLAKELGLGPKALEQEEQE